MRRNIVSLFALQGISYLAPLATLPYLVRVLGPDKFGLLAFAQATIQFFVILTEYGFNLSANRQVSIHRNDPARLRTIFWSTLSIKLLLMTVGFMILLGLVFSADRFRAEWSVYVIMYLMVVGYALLPAWYLQGREMMRHVAGMHVAATLISVSAIFLFVHDERDYLLAALIQSSTLVIAAIIGLVVVWKVAPVAPTVPRIADIRAAIRDGWEVFVSTMATSLYTSSNVLVLGFFGGNVAVGYFSAADKITRAVQGMFTPITLAMYPRINALAGVSRETALGLIRRGLGWLLVASMIASILLFLLADYLVPLLVGPEFIESVPLVKIMAFLPVLMTANYVLGIHTMLSFGLKRQYRNVLVLIGACNVLVVVVLTMFLEGQGTAVAVVLAEAAILLSMLRVISEKGIRIWPRYGRFSNEQ